MARVYHPSYSGYFPYCLLKLRKNPGLNYFYTAVDLQTAMKSFWVWKKISIEGQYLATSPNSLQPTIENYKMILRAGSETESGLVCNPNWVVESVTDNLISLDQSPIVVGSLNWSGRDVALDAQLDDDGVILGYNLVFYFKNTFGPEGVGLRSIIVSSGQVGTFDSYVLNGLVLYGDIGGLSFNAKVIEYWEYDGIWDKNTGQRL